MILTNKPSVAVVVPIGPGKESALDTLLSLELFCPEPHVVFIVDDHTKDGTYEALVNAKKPHWLIFRNEHPHGIQRLVHSLCFAFKQVITHTECRLILRLDQDALIIKPGLIPEALTYMNNNPAVGLFGVYQVDYNRPRSFESHRRLFNREAAWFRSLIGRRPSWKNYLRIAESKGYKRGENVFGGAYFVTRGCVDAAMKMGALNIPWQWHSKMQEDVYFSMIAVAAGFRLGHFAAPDGPLCMEWRGLPYPATVLEKSKYKLIHSVDKGPNTGPADNEGRTAREVFRELRTKNHKT
jgi:glycosyltransferase involved in cell wall biosynthesis